MNAGDGPMGNFKEQKPVYGNVMQSRPQSTGQAQSGFGFNVPGQMQAQSMYAGPGPAGSFKQQEQFYGGNVMQSRPTSTGQAQSGFGFAAPGQMQSQYSGGSATPMSPLDFQKQTAFSAQGAPFTGKMPSRTARRS
jgi:hypothetical protein